MLGVGLLVIAAAAMLWRMLPKEDAPEAGKVQVVAGPAVPPPILPTTAAGLNQGPVKRIAILSTPEIAKTVREQRYLVATEKRDRGWAERSEAAIRGLTQRISYIGGSHPLTITCAATTCEVSGIADADPATGGYAKVWERLEADTAGDDLRKDGLERTSAIFDTGRSPDEFKIYYRRVDVPAASVTTP